MIDADSEEMLTFGMAARRVPSRGSGKRVAPSTIWRWSRRGIHGVRLETLLVGGVRFTSAQALQRFFEQTTAAADGIPAPIATPAIRKRALEAAERELAADGI